MQLGSVVQSSPGLEYVQELSTGSFGALWLARLTAGPEVGRLVVARRIKLEKLDANKAEKILTAARIYGGISHPSLVKLLGVHRTEAELVWVEEQVIGVPLGKLHDLVQAQGTSVPIDIATKLVLDAVRASIALRKACRDQNLPVPELAIFPDSVTVANFGEAMLAGVGVATELARSAIIRCHHDLSDVLDPLVPVGPNNECREVFTAGATLWKLLVIRGLFDGYSNQQTLDLVLHSKTLKPEYLERLNLCVPKAIAQIVRLATARNLQRRFQSLQELAQALEALPSQYLATDSKIRDWLSDIAGDYLSDVQRSSGVRRVPFKVRASLPSSDFGGRPSFIPTPLPGFHEPFIPKPPADTIPSILAPAEMGEQDAARRVEPVAPVSASAVTTQKRRSKFWVALVVLTLAALGLAYALAYKAQIRAVTNFSRAFIGRWQPKRQALSRPSPATSPDSARSNNSNAPPQGSDAASLDQTQTQGSAGTEPNSNDPGTASKSGNHSKHKVLSAKPAAAPSKPSAPDGINRWGI